MTITKQLCVLTVYVILLCLMPDPILYAATGTIDRSQTVVVHVKKGMLTASARNVPLHLLLEKIAAQTGLGFEMYGHVDRQITVELKNVPLNNGIKRILKGCNSTIIYTDHSSLKSAVIHKIIVYDKNGGTNGPPIQSQISRIAPPSNISPADRRQQKHRKTKLITRKWPPKSAKKINISAYSEQLRSEDWERRRDAVFDIADAYPEEALPYLELALLNDGSEEVRALAAEKIGDLGNEAGIPPLAKGINDPDTTVREAVIEALREIGGPEAVPPLQQALQDSNEDIRDAAADLISEINSANHETDTPLSDRGIFFLQQTTGPAGGQKQKNGEK